MSEEEQMFLMKLQTQLNTQAPVSGRQVGTYSTVQHKLFVYSMIRVLSVKYCHILYVQFIPDCARTHSVLIIAF